MVVGDIITGIGSDGSDLTFQPATGVEIIITQICNELTTAFCFLTDGTKTATISKGMITPINVKCGITNTIYLNIGTAGGGKYVAYSGIQVK